MVLPARQRKLCGGEHSTARLAYFVLLARLADRAVIAVAALVVKCEALCQIHSRMTESAFTAIEVE